MSRIPPKEVSNGNRRRSRAVSRAAAAARESRQVVWGFGLRV